MMIPVRCYSCGNVVGQFWDEYNERVKKGEDPKAVLDSLGLKRYCCRSVLLGHVDLIDEVAKFKKF
jgi:DNA-directed RNA polymerase subunit N